VRGGERTLNAVLTMRHVAVISTMVRSLHGPTAFKHPRFARAHAQSRPSAGGSVTSTSRCAGGWSGSRGMHGGVGDMLRGLTGRPEYTGTQRPSVLGPRRAVPSHIVAPDYAKDGNPKTFGPTFGITVHTPEEIACAREAGRVAREVLDVAGAAVRVGATTDEIDEAVHQATIDRGAYPSPLHYHGFPKSVCTSINEVVCHGIPGTNITLNEGDIVNIDVSCYYMGFHGDNSEMFCVGEVDQKSKALIQATYDCWQAAIAICKPGVPYNAIGAVIEEYVTARGMTTTKNFCGHGVGRVFHMAPQVVHYKVDHDLGVMAPGNIFTIEPMIQLGGEDNIMWGDAWTIATSDGSRSAQFEHTLLVTETGVEALTAKTSNSMKQPWE